VLVTNRKKDGRKNPFLAKMEKEKRGKGANQGAWQLPIHHKRLEKLKLISLWMKARNLIMIDDAAVDRAGKAGTTSQGVVL